MTKALNPPTLSANALKSAAGTYSLASVARVRSLTKGMAAVASFSPAAAGGDGGRGDAGAGAAIVGAGAGTAAGGGEGDGALLLATSGPLGGGANSSLVK
jgi:hypothetical protein